jgi:hypothetical protein
MISQTFKPASYDAGPLANLQEAFDTAWAVTQSRYPSRTPAKDHELRTYLSEAIIALAEAGIADPNELCKLALERLPPAR